MTGYAIADLRTESRAGRKIGDCVACRRILVFVMAVAGVHAAPLRLRCDYLENPLGIDARAPHLSWISASAERNWRQTAYQIVVRSGQETIWDTGKQSSAESNGLPYAGPSLESRRRYRWTVRVWDAHDQPSTWAKEAWWETGLLAPADWKAKWIAAVDSPAPPIRWIGAGGQDTVFRFSLDLPLKPRDAVLWLMARGSFRARINDREVAAKKNWHEFDRQDIARYLKAGANTIEVSCSKPGNLAALLQITRADGTVERFATDRSWQAGGVAAIELNENVDSAALPSPATLLRHTFPVAKAVAAARVYVTALGSYRLFLNGSRVGRDVLTPDFTDYRKRVLYQTYDVTGLLTPGENVLGAVLGDGWFASGLGWTGQRFAFLPAPTRLLAQLEIDYTDGSHATMVTDEGWKTAPSPILHSEIYAGEVYDARLEQPNWNRPRFNDTGWNSAVASGAPAGILSSQRSMPVQITAALKPKSITPRPDATFVYDMGQNMVGWVRLRVTGPAGTQVRLRFAERLAEDGGIYIENLRNANATDVYTLRGGAEETYEPHFTFHGFRYVEVSGYPGTPGLSAITGQVTSSVADFTGKLTTSSELINRMWEIAIWGQRGNFLSIPTDCPQRDERLGWMGDAGVFWRTATYNADVAAFSHKWMRDVVDAQSAQGGFSDVSPRVVDMMDGAPGWGDAGIIVPYTTWLQYGDRAILEENWDAMERWMQYILAGNADLVRKKRLNNNFGDWLPANSETPKDLIATAYWAYCAELMTQMAHALGKESDAQRYAELYQGVRAAFQKAYIQESGETGSGSQTAYVLALYVKLAPPALEETLVKNLVADIEKRGGHLSTGFLGTPFLLSTLTAHGRADVAYRLLLNETYPSWGYMLQKGATTWWERWNGDKGDPAMNSYNHYAFGSVVAFIYRSVAGIDTVAAAPGFHQIVIRPILDDRVTHARGEYDSVYGRVVSDWTGTSHGPFSLKVTIPPNCTATIYLPKAPMESGKPVESTREGASYVVRVGSGSYTFQ